MSAYNSPNTNTPTTNTSDKPRVLSSSSITGTQVVNLKNENIGEIKDLMIDLRSGSIEYVVLSFGGFLGIGDKLFAVPMESFDVDSYHEKFVLDINKERLENAPGFDKDNWPATNDNTFTNSVYQHYGVQRRNRTMNDPRMS